MALVPAGSQASGLASCPRFIFDESRGKKWSAIAHWELSSLAGRRSFTFRKSSCFEGEVYVSRVVNFYPWYLPMEGDTHRTNHWSRQGAQLLRGAPQPYKADFVGTLWACSEKWGRESTGPGALDPALGVMTIAPARPVRAQPRASCSASRRMRCEPGRRRHVHSWPVAAQRRTCN